MKTVGARWSTSRYALCCHALGRNTCTYALQCLQEVASVPCHLSSLVMAARLLGWHHMLLIGGCALETRRHKRTHNCMHWHAHTYWTPLRAHVSRCLGESEWTGKTRPVPLTVQVWSMKTNRRMRQWMTGRHNAWESWMVNGNHIVTSAAHIAVDARSLHWRGNNQLKLQPEEFLCFFYTYFTAMYYVRFVPVAPLFVSRFLKLCSFTPQLSENRVSKYLLH